MELIQSADIDRMAHRKWKETKQLPSVLSGPAVPGCSLFSFHFLWVILCPQPVLWLNFCFDVNKRWCKTWWTILYWACGSLYLWMLLYLYLSVCVLCMSDVSRITFSLSSHHSCCWTVKNNCLQTCQTFGAGSFPEKKMKTFWSDGQLLDG